MRMDLLTLLHKLIPNEVRLNISGVFGVMAHNLLCTIFSRQKNIIWEKIAYTNSDCFSPDASKQLGLNILDAKSDIHGSF